MQEKNSSERSNHKCILCGAQFNNGRQLGGHMSRRHPGNSVEYVIKKQVQSTKKLERRRRNYFKSKRMKNLQKLKNIDEK